MRIGNTFYHAAEEAVIESLVAEGMDSPEAHRDYGYFGDGFPVARYPEIAEGYGEALAEVRVHNGAQVFNAGETFPDDSIVPESIPSWHADFLNWYQAQLHPMFQENWITEIAPSVTPIEPEFDRLKWYTKVTEYAAAQGYPIIYWSDAEIVIRDLSIVTNVAWCEGTGARILD